MQAIKNITWLQRLAMPEYQQTRQVLIAALCTTGAIFIWFAYLRLDTANPHYADIFRLLVREQDFFSTLPFALVLVVALMGRVQQTGRAVAAWIGRNGVLVAGATCVLLAVGANLIYHAHPLTMDEYAPYFQSQIFAAGELAARYPPELIDWLFVKNYQGHFFRIARDTGSVASTYWPGMALLLAPFTAMGVPWLLNPVIGGATVFVMHRLAREIFADDDSTGLAVLFTVASPAVTLNAVSFYSMPAHLLASALFVLLLLRPSPKRAASAGLVGSVALVLHNPVPHLLFALPWIVWIAVRPDRLRLLAALVAGYLPLCVVLGWGWVLYLRGFASQAPAAEVASSIGAVQSAFHALSSLLRVPSGWIVEARLIGLAKIWLWAAPGLLAIAAVGFWRSRNETGFWFALGVSVLVTYLGYFLVPLDQGHGWGFRYFHSAWLALPLFAVHALRAPDQLGQPASDRLRGYAAGCALLGLVVMTAVQGYQIERFMTRHLAQSPLLSGEGRRVIFIEPTGFYAEDLAQNDPFLRAPVITLVSRGRDLDQAMMREHFPSFELLSSDARGSVWGVPAQPVSGWRAP